ncbi:HNH endonuclease [Ruegeria faecimaris]|uniref:HNH endonuclease n=1 Tax=Ruegeria faecimaris TaxID=686389 RepID=UPI00248F899D|nr:HNH endonuclease [Ruegeria faecimaris]
MNRFVVKVNSDGCPNGIPTPGLPSDWENGTIEINKPGARSINSLDRTGLPTVAVGDEVWVCTDKFGPGIAAKARIATVERTGRPVQFSICEISLFSPTIPLDSFERLASGSAVFSRLQASRRPDIYHISDEEYDEFQQVISTEVPAQIFDKSRDPAKQVLFGEALVRELESLNFVLQHTTEKVSRLCRGSTVVYVKNVTRSRPLVLHPAMIEWAPELCTLFELDAQPAAKVYKNSNLTLFPQFRDVSRSSPGHFGFAVGVNRSNLSQLLRFVDSKLSLEASGESIRLSGSSDRPLTERERLQAARLGQGDFRFALIASWQGTCPVTGVNSLEILRASHIKPWAKSDDRERLDPDNGLLLCAHIDALFDRGLVSFTDSGEIMVSSSLSAGNIDRLGLENSTQIVGLSLSHKKYLSYHRKHVFRK